MGKIWLSKVWLGEICLGCLSGQSAEMSSKIKNRLKNEWIQFCTFVPYFHISNASFYNLTPPFLAIYVFDQKIYPLQLDSNQPPPGYESAMLPLSHDFHLYVMCLEKSTWAAHKCKVREICNFVWKIQLLDYFFPENTIILQNPRNILRIFYMQNTQAAKYGNLVNMLQIFRPLTATNRVINPENS